MATQEPPIASPCVKICVLGEDGICRGCYRTTDEIMAWPSANNEQKRQFVSNAEARFLANREKGN